MIELSAKFEEQYWTYSTCFDPFNNIEDIIEITHDEENGVCIERIWHFIYFFKLLISVKIIDRGQPHDLKFGLNNAIDVISINKNNQSCTEHFEEAALIRIHNGTVVSSECVQAFLVLNTYSHMNVPMVLQTQGTSIYHTNDYYSNSPLWGKWPIQLPWFVFKLSCLKFLLVNERSDLSLIFIQKNMMMTFVSFINTTLKSMVLVQQHSMTSILLSVVILKRDRLDKGQV